MRCTRLVAGAALFTLDAPSDGNWGAEFGLHTVADGKDENGRLRRYWVSGRRT